MRFGLPGDAKPIGQGASQNQAYIAHALGVAARAKGMLDVARQSGLARPQLYRSLSEQGNPTLHSLLAILDSLGLELSVKNRLAA